MRKFFKKITTYFSEIVVDEKKRSKALLLFSYVIASLVALAMTLLNISTEKGILTAVTFVFSLLCLLNLILTLTTPGLQEIVSIVFEFETISMFTFFVVSGNPDGFSAIWAAMLPITSMLLFGTKRGVRISFIMLVILVFFFYTPFGRDLLLYDYNETFLMRFPLLYTAFFAMSFMLSYIVQRMQGQYNFISNHDPLTMAYNRRGFMNYIKGEISAGNYTGVGFIIFDLDFFKAVNDQHGHFNGDIVLAEVYKAAQKVCPYPICRWGGEEFSVFIPEGEKTQQIAENINKLLDKTSIRLSTGIEITQTVSVGAVHVRNYISLDRISIQADACLYEAKNSGRNKVVFKEY